MLVFEKLASESFIVGVDFTDQLPESSTISTGTAAAYDEFDRTVSSTFFASTTLTVDSGEDTASARLAAVSNQPVGRYRCKYTITLSSSEVLVEEFLVYVRETTV